MAIDATVTIEARLAALELDNVRLRARIEALESAKETRYNKHKAKTQSLPQIDAKARIKEVYMALSEARRTGVINIYDIRRESGLNCEVFEETILALAMDFEVDLIRGDNTYFNEDERKNSYHDSKEDVIYYYLAWR